MIKPYSGYEAAKAPSSSREPLPAGGYVARLHAPRLEAYSWGTVLVLPLDIAEGEYANFWRDDFAANPREDKKWRGNLRITLPKDDGSEKDGWAKRVFNNFVWAIEESNPGYKWRWDETTLNGKLLGVIYRNKEWEMNGTTGWTTEAFSTTSVACIRDGAYSIPKDKFLTRAPSAVPSSFTPLPPDDDGGELPF